MSISQFTLEESYSLSHGLERVNTLADTDLLTDTNAYLFYILLNKVTCVCVIVSPSVPILQLSHVTNNYSHVTHREMGLTLN